MPNDSVDAVCSQMLFCMALSTDDFVALSAVRGALLRPVARRAALGSKTFDVEPFEEGDLPRRVWRVTPGRTGSLIDVRD